MNDKKRLQLIAELEKLVTVTYDAMQKVELAMTKEGADLERLGKISTQFRETIRNCGRALEALTTNQPNVDLSKTPITQTEIQSIDWDDLSRKIGRP